MKKNTIELDNNVKIFTRELTGINEVVSLAKKVLDDPEAVNNASIDGNSYFTGSDSLEQAIDLCENGWEEGTKRASVIFDEVDLSDEITQIRPIIDYVYDQAGDEPDIDRYISGEPEDMVTFYQDHAAFGKILSLKVNFGQHAFVSEERIMLRGLIVSAAAGLIATAGYGLQVDAVEHIGVGDNRLEYTVPLVNAGEYFNLDTVIFALAHPSFLRRLMFAVEEQEPSEIRDKFGIYKYGGYGIPKLIRKEEGDRSMVVDKDDYLVSSSNMIPESAHQLASRLLSSASNPIYS